MTKEVPWWWWVDGWWLYDSEDTYIAKGWHVLLLSQTDGLCAGQHNWGRVTTIFVGIHYLEYLIIYIMW